jgi:hypothetical protein
MSSLGSRIEANMVFIITTVNTDIPAAVKCVLITNVIVFCSLVGTEGDTCFHICLMIIFVLFLVFTD